ncbi:MAG TPA: hypothetical protein VGO62_13860, partial [Myxococcota bacterium]
MSLACLAMITLAATMLFSIFTAVIKRSKIESSLLRRSQALLEYVVNESRRVGGQGAPATASVFVENDCGAARGFPDCNHTDRVTFAEPLAGYGSCRVKTDQGAHFIEVNDVRLGAGTTCCFSAPVFGRQVVFVKDSVVTPAFLTRAPGPCRFHYRRIVQDPSTSLDNAQIILSDVKTFYLEPSSPPGLAGRLVMHMDLDGDESIAGERLVLSNG